MDELAQVLSQILDQQRRQTLALEMEALARLIDWAEGERLLLLKRAVLRRIDAIIARDLSVIERENHDR